MDIFKEQIWLPHGVSWTHFESSEGFAKFRDILLPIPGAFLLIILRGFLEQKLFRPYGRYLGLSYYEASDSYTLSGWIRRKLSRQKLSTLDKFCETGWRWIFYLFLHLLGLRVMWRKPWTWDPTLFWQGYPNHFMDDGVWWYYMLELSFYWSLAISQFVDVKRKDFVEMFLHHLFALVLLTISWSTHLHRVGSAVLLIHDIADHWLELGKMAKYANYQRLCDAVFVIFCSTWVFTRMGIYPTIILYSTTVELVQVLDVWPMYYLYNFLLTGLLVLHLFWTYFILKAAYKAVFFADDVSDNRSESSGDSDPEEENSEEISGDAIINRNSRVEELNGCKQETKKVQ